MAKFKSHSQKELQSKRMKESYAQMEPAIKKKVLSDRAIWYGYGMVITAFQSKIWEGSYYICSVCNRILYRKIVIQLKNKCTTLNKNYLLSK